MVWEDAGKTLGPNLHVKKTPVAHSDNKTTEEEKEEEERGKRQVLVLGLDGAGKSSMLQGLTPGESAAKRGRCQPTRGFNFMSLNAPACQLDFLESKIFIPVFSTVRITLNNSA